MFSSLYFECVTAEVLHCTPYSCYFSWLEMSNRASWDFKSRIKVDQKRKMTLLSFFKKSCCLLPSLTTFLFALSAFASFWWCAERNRLSDTWDIDTKICIARRFSNRTLVRSASEMTYIVLSGALNSTHSLVRWTRKRKPMTFSEGHHRH